MIVIIDYGMGNVASILNMFKKIGEKNVVLSGDAGTIAEASKIILPGVGAFDTGMRHLREHGLIDVLNKKAHQEKVPVLGICLGMQLMTKRSEEGTEPGLGWFDAETKKFVFEKEKGLKVPHMGWNYIKVMKEDKLLHRDQKFRFYFVHSYYVLANDRSDSLATCDYGSMFDAALQKDNLWGMQYHPEKSHKFGMAVFKNFSELR